MYLCVHVCTRMTYLPIHIHPQYEERELRAVKGWDDKLAQLRDHRDKLRAQLEYEEGQLYVNV